MVFTAVIGLIATISALFTMVLEFPVFCAAHGWKYVSHLLF
jgi:hypothetical protein